MSARTEHFKMAEQALEFSADLLQQAEVDEDEAHRLTSYQQAHLISRAEVWAQIATAHALLANRDAMQA